MPKQKIVIGIHGLANKPPRETLQAYWEKSLHEGLRKNCGIAQPDFPFELVFWADLLYKQQQHDDPNFDFDDLYNDEPYRAAGKHKLKEYKEGYWDYLREQAQDWAEPAYKLGRKAGLGKLADAVLSSKLKDLDYYYDKRRKIAGRDGKRAVARQVLMAELSETLERHRNREILLIAHSMGSIVAYDVLRNIGRTDKPFPVPHFVTIGSPLGLPLVKENVYRERRTYDPKAPLRAPTIVRKSWVNYADRLDPVAFDTSLGGDYGRNKHGVGVMDDLVLNDYTSPGGDRNHHKSYGYLRTPELSRHLRGFLGL